MHTLPLAQETAFINPEKTIIAGYSVDPLAAGMIKFNLLFVKCFFLHMGIAQNPASW
jgi:hypothetical protein